MSATTLPRVAIVYEPESIPLLDLTATAARNGFHLVWVTNGVDARMLDRLGTVVTTVGLSPNDIAQQLTRLDVVGITTFADDQIEQTAALASLMNLPGNSATTAHRLVNKIAQRQALADAGLPGPSYVGIQSPADIAVQRKPLEKLRYPVVIKPAFGFGGLDTFCLPNAAAVHDELDIRRAAGPWQSTIIEECLGTYPPLARNGFGDYVSVEMLVESELESVVAITGRMPLAEPFRETGAFLPSTLSPTEQSDVIDMAVRAARALEVRHGCLHIEIKLTDAGPRIIEVNGRVPGGGIVDLVSTFTGVDLFECALKSALGHPTQRKASATASGVCYQLALQPPIGRRVRLMPRWSDQARKIRGLESVTLRSTEAEVDIREGSYGYLLMAAGVANDHCALLDTHHSLARLLVAD
ncbi:putative ATP-grasp superfamily ATP-dependent carboligase [Mycobacterium sp. MAA66]|uniref:ATP-grasp domain-containing protein n=1 Tax=Mycobacterium sp. MAA66 TaxID=3156297 RepID=UPI0035151F2F